MKPSSVDPLAFLEAYLPSAVRSEDSVIAMPFPDIQGRMDAAESLKLYQRPDGSTYYVGPDGRELSPIEVDRIMKAGVRGA